MLTRTSNKTHRARPRVRVKARVRAPARAMTLQQLQIHPDKKPIEPGREQE